LLKDIPENRVHVVFQGLPVLQGFLEKPVKSGIQVICFYFILSD
jgi:hypothetical protein